MRSLQRETIFKGCWVTRDRLRSLIVAYTTLTHSIIFGAVTCNLVEMSLGGGEKAGEGRSGGGGRLESENKKVVMARKGKELQSRLLA